MLLTRPAAPVRLVLLCDREFAVSIFAYPRVRIPSEPRSTWIAQP